MSDKSLPWLRLYTEIIDDEKLGLLAFEDRWHYVALLCCKQKGILDTPCTPVLMKRKVANKLGLTTAELENVARRLSEVDLIDFETMQPLAWDTRQMVSDTSTSRVKAFRDRKRAEKQGETFPKRYGNGIDTDTDTDLDKENTYFERAWEAYPDRPGKSKQDSRKAWNARINAGVDPEAILQGVVAYAEYCVAARTEPGFIKQPATFFGPGQHFLSDWTPPAPRGAGRLPGVKSGDIGEIPDAD